MSIENARKYLEKFNVTNRILEFNESSATVDMAAHALGCEPERIAKTLSFLVNDDPVLIVTAGDTKIDNSKYKSFFGTKAKMIPSEDLVNLVGHEAGGVCPFGVNEGVKVYLDNSLKRFDTVFPACGSANSAIELTIEELEKYSNFVEWIDVSKKIEEKSEC